jgi:hypothetical protein
MNIRYLHQVLIILFFISSSNLLSANDHKVWIDEILDITDYPTIKEEVKEGIIFTINDDWNNSIATNKPYDMSIEMPLPDGSFLNLDLTTSRVVSSDFKVTAFDGVTERTHNGDLGAHYSGEVRGYDSSIAALSFSSNGIMGVFSTQERGNFVVGVLENIKKDGQQVYIIYNDSDLLITSNFECHTDDSHASSQDVIPDNPFRDQEDIVVEFCTAVRIYVEADNKFYLQKGLSVDNVTDHVLGMYNVNIELYRQIGVDLVVSEVFVWTEDDPYTYGDNEDTPGYDALDDFRILRTSTGFNGDLAQLCTGLPPQNGGVAYLNGLCNPSYSFSYCQLFLNYSQLPLYSWDVVVVCHELGHNFSSPHTHSCSWNGNNTSIDGCVGAEGSCSDGPIPTDGGTVMSYCHLNDAIGVNLAYGFGPQPSAKIFNFISNANCVGSDSGNPICGELVYNNISCNGLTDGRAEITNTNVASIEWSNGETTAMIDNLTPGTYSVTITADNGDVAITEINVIEPEGMTLDPNISDASSESASDGYAFVYVVGGTEPHVIEWWDGTINQFHGGLAGGVYAVTITDASGCILNDNIIVQPTNATAVNSIIALESMNVFPNPSLDGTVTLDVKFNKSIDAQIDIFNYLGQKVDASIIKNSASHTEAFSVKEWADGTYFLRIMHEGEYEVVRFVVAK